MNVFKFIVASAPLLTTALALQSSVAQAGGVMDGGGSPSTELVCNSPSGAKASFEMSFISIGGPTQAIALIRTADFHPGPGANDPSVGESTVTVNRSVYLGSAAVYTNHLEGPWDPSKYFTLYCGLSKAPEPMHDGQYTYMKISCDISGTFPATGETFTNEPMYCFAGKVPPTHVK